MKTSPLLIGSLLLLYANIHAQHLISFGGSFIQNNQYSLSYSFGEIAIHKLINGGDFLVTQGYQQPSGAQPEVTQTDLEFYNAITPGIDGINDGLNDYFFIEGIDNYPDNQLTIINRWGEIVYQEQGYDNESVRWDGYSYNGKLLPQATYYYVLILNRREKPNVFKGSIDILYQK